MVKILTVCRAGLVRSVALANVIKLHFAPVDVLNCGVGEHQLGRMNQLETLEMLFKWADKIVVMESHYLGKLPLAYQGKTVICEVGPDRWNNPNHPELIGMVFDWMRKNKHLLEIEEHNLSL